MKNRTLFALALSAGAALVSVAAADITVNLGNFTLSGSQSATHPTITGVSGTLTSVDISIDFVSDVDEFSWCSDAAIVVNGFQWGGYNVHFGTNTTYTYWSFDGAGSATSGTYTDNRTDIDPSITNPTTLDIVIGNGYTGSDPVQYNNVTVILRGVTLDPTAPTNPAITGAVATPNSAAPGTSVVISANVTPGTNPDDSASLVVTADLSSAGGSAAAPLTHGAGTLWTLNTTIPPGGTETTPVSFIITLNAYDASVPVRNAAPRTVTLISRSNPWDEQTNGAGDSGQDLATAQIPTGSGELGAISGTFLANDVDIFKIKVCDASLFSATTQYSTPLSDTQLFLFNPDGTGVSHNDDSDGGTYSTMDNTGVVSGNTYFLAVSHYNTDPVDAGGLLLWNNTNPGGTFTGTRAPDGPGAANALDHWTGTTAAGPYRISLTGACYAGPGACSAADIGVQGGVPGQDRLLDNNDFIVFIANFFSQLASADIGIQGGVAGHDNAWDNNDFIVYIGVFFTDFPNCTGNP